MQLCVFVFMLTEMLTEYYLLALNGNTYAVSQCLYEIYIRNIYYGAVYLT